MGLDGGRTPGDWEGIMLKPNEMPFVGLIQAGSAARAKVADSWNRADRYPSNYNVMVARFEEKEFLDLAAAADVVLNEGN